jgi:hypothetical protein
MRRKRNTAPIAEVKKLLKAGNLLRIVTAHTGYSKGELSLMCKCWGIARGGGRRKVVPDNETDRNRCSLL